MYMVGKHQAQAETDIRQAKILNDLLEKLTKNFTTLNKNAMHMAEVFKTASEKTTQIKDKLAGDRSHERALIKQLNIEKETLDIKMKGLKEDREEQGRQKESRNRNRLDEIRTQGENVRHNLKMRQLYKDQGQSLSNVMNLMTGMSGRGAVMGGISTAFNTLSLGSNILETNKNLKEAKEQKKNLEDNNDMFVNEQDYKEQLKQFTARVDRLTAILTEQREKLGMFGKFGGAGIDDSKWAKRLEPIMTWAKKNKTGIIISAASIGLLFMTFKKLLSVSPMLQKMLEVIGLAFNLILRPFGDFIGFILRPLAMSFLTMVMPLFQKAYPLLMELGTTIGEALSNWKFGEAITAVLETFPPMKMIGAIGAKLGLGEVSDEDNDKADVLLAGGAILGVGGGALAGTYGTYRATKFGFNKIFGKGGTPSEDAKVGDKKQTKMDDYDDKGKKKTKIGNIMKHLEKLAGAKLAITTASRAMMAFKLSNPIGWAMLGWEGVTSAIKHLDPEMYQSMRDSTEFMGMGREFIGLGENSLAEHGMMANDWLSTQGSLMNGNTGQGGGSIAPININLNIDKVEKGVDVNMIALQVKAILETNDRYVTN